MALLFFLRFWLMLGAASPWIETKFSRLWCCLPHRWFAINSPCSSWFSRSDFWWSDIYALFHSLGMVPWFADFVLYPLPFMFFHLVAAFITARISGGSPFRYVCQSRFGYWFHVCMLCWLRWLFLLLSLGFGFSVLTFHSHSLSLFVLFPSFPWYRGLWS